MIPRPIFIKPKLAKNIASSPIASPSPIITPRRVSHDTFPTMACSQPVYSRNLTPKPHFSFKSDIDDSVNTKEKLILYQKEFDRFINQFQGLRPVMERIKTSYDSVISMCMQKLRYSLVDESLDQKNEDYISDLISQLRHARTNEFIKSKAELDRLLETLTSLRLEKSELKEQLLSLQSIDSSLQEELIQKSELISIINTNNADCIIQSNDITNRISRVHKKIANIEKQIKEHEESYQELNINYCKIRDELRTKKQELISNEKRFEELKLQKESALSRIRLLKQNQKNNNSFTILTR